MDERKARKAAAWYQLKAWFAKGELLTAPDHGQLGQSSIAKGGHNDLSRWAAFGGKWVRPPPPAPIIRGIDLAAGCGPLDR